MGLFHYARCLENGLGVPASTAQAQEFHAKAAAAGVKPDVEWRQERGGAAAPATLNEKNDFAPCLPQGRSLQRSLMNSGMIKTGVFLGTHSLTLTGFQNMTPGGNAAVFGSLNGVPAETVARAAGMKTAQSIAVRTAVGAVVAATTSVAAKNLATEPRRRLSEQNARIDYGRLSAENKAVLRARKTRYIAGDTAKDERTAPNAQKSVMIWDPQSQQVVGNKVFDVQSESHVGSTAKLDTYSAEYVGKGS